MLRKLFLLLTLFVILGVSPLFKLPAFATDEFGECSLPNKPTNLDEGDRVIPEGLIINTNGNADPSQSYYVIIRRTDGRGGQGGVLNDTNGPILFHPDSGGNIIINRSFDHNGNTVGDHLDPFSKGFYTIWVTDVNMDNKCQRIFYDPARISDALDISIAEGIAPEDPASTKSCPLCPDGFAWYEHEKLCGKGSPVEFVPSLSRVDCSAKGTSCVPGEGYCINPAPIQTCKTYNALGASCNPSLKNPGDCADGLKCDLNTKKCVRQQSGYAVCYKCQGSNVVWNGQFCQDGNISGINIDACIEPESREYCTNGEVCDSGRGCGVDPNKPPPVGGQTENLPKTPCQTVDGTKDAKGFNENGECVGVASGLGIDIPSDPAKLITTILSIVLSLSGGIAVILIIRAGYKLMVSQGDPEKIQESKNELTSAIAGLLFIIFSFVIIQFVTTDLLRLNDPKISATTQDSQPQIIDRGQER